MFDSVITMNELLIFGACAAVGCVLFLLWLRKDTASENRHKDYIDLSNICHEEGMEMTAELLKCAAVDDLSGMYLVVQRMKATLLNPDARVIHFAKLMKVQLAKPANKQLVLDKAAEYAALDAK